MGTRRCPCRRGARPGGADRARVVRGARWFAGRGHRAGVSRPRVGASRVPSLDGFRGADGEPFAGAAASRSIRRGSSRIDRWGSRCSGGSLVGGCVTMCVTVGFVGRVTARSSRFQTHDERRRRCAQMQASRRCRPRRPEEPSPLRQPTPSNADNRHYVSSRGVTPVVRPPLVVLSQSRCPNPSHLVPRPSENAPTSQLLVPRRRLGSMLRLHASSNGHVSCARTSDGSTASVVTSTPSTSATSTGWPATATLASALATTRSPPCCRPSATRSPSATACRHAETVCKHALCSTTCCGASCSPMRRTCR